MKKDIEKLLADHKKLIEFEASKNAQFIPLTVMQSEAYKLARKAANSFDPSKGYAFSTHLTNQLQKLKRLSTRYGNTARLPEDKQFELTKLNRAEQMLKSELGREPTLEELSTAAGMNLSSTAHLLRNRKKEVNLNNLAYTPVFIEGDQDDWIHFVYHDLPARDKVIFEHKTGFGNKPELSNEELAKMLKVSPSTVNNRIRVISERLAEGWTNYGS